MTSADRGAPRDALRRLLARALGAREVAAAVCCRWEEGELTIGLVSTRDGRRWTLPKGGREPGETLAQAAAREAREEAGIHGAVDERCLGHYRYPSRRGEDRVAAFLLHVSSVGPSAEPSRARVWCDPVTAGRRLAEDRAPVHARQVARVLAAAQRELAASRARLVDGSGSAQRRRG